MAPSCWRWRCSWCLARCRHRLSVRRRLSVGVWIGPRICASPNDLLPAACVARGVVLANTERANQITLSHGKEKRELHLGAPLAALEDEQLSLGLNALVKPSNVDQNAFQVGLVESRTSQTGRFQPGRQWEMRAVEPGLVRIATGPLTPSREVMGVVWQGTPLPLDAFLEAAGSEGWEIVAGGNIGERHHRLYLKRPRTNAEA